jgi:hypothetical protein
MKDVNANARALAISAVLNNLDKFPNIDFAPEFAPILIKQLTKGLTGSESYYVDVWSLNNFSAIMNFLVVKKLMKDNYAKVLKCFFEVLHFNKK